MLLRVDSVLSEASTTTVKLESTQSELRSFSESDWSLGSLFVSQTAESSCPTTRYSVSRPGMESGGAQRIVTLLDVTLVMVRNWGAAGATRREKWEIHVVECVRPTLNVGDIHYLSAKSIKIAGTMYIRGATTPESHGLVCTSVVTSQFSTFSVQKGMWMHKKKVPKNHKYILYNRI